MVNNRLNIEKRTKSVQAFKSQLGVRPNINILRKAERRHTFSYSVGLKMGKSLKISGGILQHSSTLSQYCEKALDISMNLQAYVY